MKLGGREPLTHVHEVHQLASGDDAAHGIEEAFGAWVMFQPPGALARLNVVLELVEAEPFGTQRLEQGPRKARNAWFHHRDDSPGGGAHQYLPSGGPCRNRCWHRALVTTRR